MSVFRLFAKRDELVVILAWTILTAAVVGTIGFLIGFVGPIVFYPDSNQGPLLGFFVTGPLGALAGAVIGCCIGLFKVTRGNQVPRQPGFPVDPKKQRK